MIRQESFITQPIEKINFIFFFEKIFIYGWRSLLSAYYILGTTAGSSDTAVN